MGCQQLRCSGCVMPRCNLEAPLHMCLVNTHAYCSSYWKVHSCSHIAVRKRRHRSCCACHRQGQRHRGRTHNHRQKTDKSSFLCAGTVPVAHATGGLKDTVITYNEHQKDGTTGFAFEGVSADSLKAALWDCLQLYRSITFFCG